MSREERVRERLNSHGAMGLVALELAALNDLLVARSTDEITVERPVSRLSDIEWGEECWVKARRVGVCEDEHGEVRMQTMHNNHIFWMFPNEEARPVQ